MKILTIGIDSINKSLFKSGGTNSYLYLNKPNFGLFGSTLYYKDNRPFSDWARFLYEENWVPNGYKVEKKLVNDKRVINSIYYSLKKDAKICTVKDLDSYHLLLDKYPSFLFNDGIDPKLIIDFNKLKNDFDAFHLTEDGFYELRMLDEKYFIMILYIE